MIQLKELDLLLNVLKKNFTLINRMCGDNFGIPLITKEDKTLYIKKKGSSLSYITKGQNIKNGIDDIFDIKDILVAAGEFNRCFSNIHQKYQYFTEILELLNGISNGDVILSNKEGL